ncbi:hypothetical protein [Cognatishimia maritima]|uniref:Uncharacterized protein n=1 Tax=Cognatishimia maritima TaxID=870908 RepID=A0A1M5PJ73_9RHOB|nr:hypothetical protein [Cognatishimia maritima]SHH01866.1 hypothetical protein SAMN04488044_1841 [Cognatishimia maritima]
MNSNACPGTYISDIFKYISHYRRKGHQIGRKIGDMLEVLTMAAMKEDPEIWSKLVIEPKLEGFSGAGHKVEFAVYNEHPGNGELPPIDQLLAFIECKKVGVEQTVNGTFKRNFGQGKNHVAYGKNINFSMNPRWAAERVDFSVVFSSEPEPGISVSQNGKTILNAALENEHRFIFGLTVDAEPFFLNNNQSLREIKPSVGASKILEIMSINEDGVVALLNDCLTGPQTPEKAKQASFVALDLRKGRFGQFDKRDNESDLVSVLVMTEISHWEEKSRNMVRACIDHNLVVRDEIIVFAFEKFEQAFGDSFLEQITKEKLGTDLAVTQLCKEIVNHFDLKIFTDLDTGKEQTIRYGNGSVIVD